LKKKSSILIPILLGHLQRLAFLLTLRWSEVFRRDGGELVKCYSSWQKKTGFGGGSDDDDGPSVGKSKVLKDARQRHRAYEPPASPPSPSASGASKLSQGKDDPNNPFRVRVSQDSDLESYEEKYRMYLSSSHIRLYLASSRNRIANANHYSPCRMLPTVKLLGFWIQQKIFKFLVDL
jgi:hypothetical protein